MTIVALPIAIVTSWFLFQRGMCRERPGLVSVACLGLIQKTVFRGQERKRLVRDPIPRGVGGGGGGNGLKE